MITRLGDDVSARRCVVFDFDGTLADTKPTIVETATKVLLDWGIDEDVVAKRVDDLVGPPFPQAFCLVFGVSDADAEEITRRYRKIYFTKGGEAWPLFPGMREMLTALRSAGKRTCVASSKPHHMIERGVTDNDANDLFDTLVGSQKGVIDSKVAAIRAAVEATGCRLDDAVMVGDRYHDVEGASTCGIPCVGVTFGGTGTREELEGAGAVAVVDTMDELLSVLLGREVTLR